MALLSETRLCLLNGVPPGERLNDVRRSSDLQPPLIFLRSSSFLRSHGVVEIFLAVKAPLFLERFLVSFCGVALILVRGVRGGGGGGGGGISIGGGGGGGGGAGGATRMFSSGLSEDIIVLLLSFMVTSILFLLQYLPI